MLIGTSTCPSPEALRQRRYRQRQAAGIQIITVAISATDVERLIDCGLLDEDAADDREAVVEAIGLLLHGCMWRTK